MQGTYGEVQLEHPLACVSYHAFAGTTRVTLENFPSKVRAAKISKTTPCKVTGGRRPVAGAKSNLTRRANHPHNSIIPKCCNAVGPRQRARRFAIVGENPHPTFNCTGSLRRAVACAWPGRALAACVPGNIDVNTTPSDTATTNAIAATEQAKADAAPLLAHEFSIEHPDPDLAEQLMANALGVPDRDAMDGILRQLVRASASGGSPDEVNLSFMISMVKSLKPRDSVEAMLVAQMVSVHVMAMRCAQHLATAQDIAQHDSAARALGRLARTFPAQIEALNRYRSHGEPAVTVQNVSVGDGGKAIVGNVTQHANVIVSNKNPASAARKAPKAAPKAAGSRRRSAPATARREAQA
jgi:hypothetical protein